MTLNVNRHNYHVEINEGETASTIRLCYCFIDDVFKEHTLCILPIGPKS